MKKSFIFFLTCYENGFEEFAECVDALPAKERLSCDTLLEILHEQEEIIFLEKGLKACGLPEKQSLRYDVTVYLLTKWYPRELKYAQLHSFYSWASKELRQFMEGQIHNFTRVKEGLENKEEYENELNDNKTKQFLALLSDVHGRTKVPEEELSI